jgi:Fe-S cluster biogenesis protein NfuA
VREIVEATITESIRPLIEADGGLVEVVSVQDATIVLRISGMCSGCPGSSFTIERVIEPLLKKAVGDSITIQVEVGPKP